jgi:hypothetical protein
VYKEEVGRESSTFPMQSGAHCSLTISSFTQRMHKMYTRYKYTAVPVGRGEELKRKKQIKRNNNNTHTLENSLVYL